MPVISSKKAFLEAFDEEIFISGNGEFSFLMILSWEDDIAPGNFSSLLSDDFVVDGFLSIVGIRGVLEESESLASSTEGFFSPFGGSLFVSLSANLVI